MGEGICHLQRVADGFPSHAIEAVIASCFVRTIFEITFNLQMHTALVQRYGCNLYRLISCTVDHHHRITVVILFYTNKGISSLQCNHASIITVFHLRNFHESGSCTFWPKGALGQRVSCL